MFLTLKIAFYFFALTPDLFPLAQSNSLSCLFLARVLSNRKCVLASHFSCRNKPCALFFSFSFFSKAQQLLLQQQQSSQVPTSHSSCGHFGITGRALLRHGDGQCPLSHCGTSKRVVCRGAMRFEPRSSLFSNIKSHLSWKSVIFDTSLSKYCTHAH